MFSYSPVALSRRDIPEYIFVPPYVPHREENPGAGQAVVVIAREQAEVAMGPSLSVR